MSFWREDKRIGVTFMLEKHVVGRTVSLRFCIVRRCV
jgi:hypothetical protein